MTRIKAWFIVLVYFFAAPVLAQEQKNVQEKPNQQTTSKKSAIPVNTFRLMLGVVSSNNCQLLSEKVNYDSVIKASSMTVAGIVFNEFGSAIEGFNNNKPLPEQQLFNGTNLEIIQQTLLKCEQLIPQEEVKKFKDFIQSNSTKK